MVVTMNTWMMDFERFTESLVQQLQKIQGEDFHVFSSLIKKNNGVVLTSIMIEERGCNTSPSIYIDSFYESYRKGMAFEKIIQEVRQLFLNSRIPGSLDLSEFECYETAKKQIAFKIVNYEKNRELLTKIPHRTVHNLAVVYYYVVDKLPFSGKASIQIRNTHIENWKISEEILHRDAIENTPKLFPAEIESMGDVLLGLMDGNIGKESEAFAEKRKNESMCGEKQQMYVLSNRQKIMGAACMLYPGVLSRFAKEKQCDIYVLPSSVHEVILLGEGAGMSPGEMLSMVTEINATQVEESEVLADAVYRYQRKEDRLEQIA